jgi:DNA modification methylase
VSNRLFYGDNLDVLREHIGSQTVDLVYLDPPFNSNRNYNVIFGRNGSANPDNAQIQAFGDTWAWTSVTADQFAELMRGGVPSKVADALSAMRTLVGENDAMAYLVNMAPRLVELHRVLKPTGSLYLHCDPTMSHYLKIMLDAIFGVSNFRNEIHWYYYNKMHDSRKKLFPKSTDTLLFYVKDVHNEFTFHQLKEQLAEPVKRLKRAKVNGKMVNVRGEDGKVEYITKTDRTLDNVWRIPMLQPASPERLGYQTQKPLALLQRVLEASSDPGDVVLDPFCGCGTTIDAAQRMDRSWVGIDVTYIAVDLIEKRLLHTFGPSIVGTYDVLGIPRDLEGARRLFDQSPFDFERWAVSRVNGTPNEKQVGDKGVDGVVRFFTDAKGNTGRVLVSVKGGKTIGPQFVRDLLGTVQTQRAEMGGLLTLAPFTRGMKDAIDHAGTYHWPINGQPFPKAQIATIEDLLAGRKLNAPPSLLPYIAADRHAANFDQLSLL